MEFGIFPECAGLMKLVRRASKNKARGYFITTTKLKS